MDSERQPTTTLGRLYLVPNTLDHGLPAEVVQTLDLQQVLPLGALQVAAGLGHWVVENARSARALLKRVQAVVPLTRPLQSLQINELPRPPKGGAKASEPDWKQWLAPALAGQDMGLLSEAGLPAVADPGARLVRAAHALGVPVMPLSGPSSLILAVAAAGLNGQSFAFVGYLPVDKTERINRLRELESHSRRWQQTQLVIETPYRNVALLEALCMTLSPDTQLNVASGLTLPGGYSVTRKISEWRRAGVERSVALSVDVPTVFSFLAS